MIRREDHTAQNGMRKPDPIVAQRNVPPVRACPLDLLHLGVTPGGVGRLEVGGKDGLQEMIGHPERRKALLEDRECRPVLQRFQRRGVDKGDLVHLLQA